ncbi:MAG: patatin-like phospholipase family protein [Bacteroidetes bacterium]|nr:MAG: patatin-like phospholipase family protein [Bacteroidota bacterium]
MPHTPYLTPPAGYTGPRRALILAGGGMRVAYQAGVLRALEEAGLCFTHADGTSGGIMNLAMLLSGLSPTAMCERWRTLRVRDFVSLMPFAEYLRGPAMAAMGDADGLVEDVFPHLGIDVARIHSAEGLDATFNVCNFTDKVNEAIPHPHIDLDLLVAGVSLPMFMPAVRKGETTYTDAVWIQDANLIDAVRRGAQELWVVWIIANTPVYRDGFFNQYVHMIEMSACGALHDAFDRIREINDRIRQGETVYGHTEPIRLHLIKPTHPLPLDPAYYFGDVDGATLVNQGYAEAWAYLETRPADGLPFTPATTRMLTSNPGITFRETMEGPFALGPSDPQTGFEQGSLDGHRLALHATITIHDLARFIADPDHAGSLVATIDFTPFGTALPARRGVFNLFSPADDPETRYMVYELAFRHGDEDYYLAGRKTIRDDPGFDLWKDTTTLFTTLHRGPDRNAPVVGAGILSLGVGDLIRLVSTMRAIHTDALTEKARTLATFGAFFLGELWDTYARHTQTDE